MALHNQTTLADKPPTSTTSTATHPSNHAAINQLSKPANLVVFAYAALASPPPPSPSSKWQSTKTMSTTFPVSHINNYNRTHLSRLHPLKGISASGTATGTQNIRGSTVYLKALELLVT